MYLRRVRRPTKSKSPDGRLLSTGEGWDPAGVPAVVSYHRVVPGLRKAYVVSGFCQPPWTSEPKAQFVGPMVSEVPVGGGEGEAMLVGPVEVGGARGGKNDPAAEQGEGTSGTSGENGSSSSSTPSDRKKKKKKSDDSLAAARALMADVRAGNVAPGKAAKSKIKASTKKATLRKKSSATANTIPVGEEPDDSEDQSSSVEEYAPPEDVRLPGPGARILVTPRMQSSQQPPPKPKTVQPSAKRQVKVDPAAQPEKLRFRHTTSAFADARHNNGADSAISKGPRSDRNGDQSLKKATGKTVPKKTFVPRTELPPSVTVPPKPGKKKSARGAKTSSSASAATSSSAVSAKTPPSSAPRSPPSSKSSLLTASAGARSAGTSSKSSLPPGRNSNSAQPRRNAPQHLSASSLRPPQPQRRSKTPPFAAPGSGSTSPATPRALSSATPTPRDKLQTSSRSGEVVVLSKSKKSGPRGRSRTPQPPPSSAGSVGSKAPIGSALLDPPSTRTANRTPPARTHDGQPRYMTATHAHKKKVLTPRISSPGSSHIHGKKPAILVGGRGRSSFVSTGGRGGGGTGTKDGLFAAHGPSVHREEVHGFG